MSDTQQIHSKNRNLGIFFHQSAINGQLKNHKYFLMQINHRFSINRKMDNKTLKFLLYPWCCQKNDPLSGRHIPTTTISSLTRIFLYLNAYNKKGDYHCYFRERCLILESKRAT